MSKKVPIFYPNQKDNLHCTQAVIKMILKYFQPEKSYSWKEIDSLTGFKKDLLTWPLQIQIKIAKMGWSVYSKELFDYEKFEKKGEEYMIERYGKKVGEIQIKNSDIEAVLGEIKDYLKYVKVENAVPTIKDVSDFLKKGYLVVCGINSAILSMKTGYSPHVVLIYKIDAKYVYLHDPGLPPRPKDKVSILLFKKAWEYPLDSDTNLIAFKPNHS